MATEDITLRLRIDELEKELSKIPGVTQKEMKKMLGVVSSTYREEERAAKKAADEQIKQAERAAREAAQAAEKQLGALERVSDKFTGGLAGDMKDLAEAGLGPLGAAGTTAAIGIGATVAALAALGAAAAGAVYGIYSIQNAASDAIKELEKMGQIELVDPEYQQIVEDTAATLDALGAAVDMVAIALAANFGPQIQAVAIQLIDLTLSVTEFLNNISDVSLIETFVRNLWMFSPVISEMVSKFGLLIQVLAYAEEALTGQPSKIRATVDEMKTLADRAFVAATGIDGLAGAQNELSTSTSRGAEFVRDYTRRVKEKEAADSAAKKTAEDAKTARDKQAESAKRAAKEERELAAAIREAEAAADAVANATETLNGIRDKSMDRFLTDQERLAKNYQDELARIDAVVERVAEHSLTLDQVAQVEAAASEARLAATNEYLAKLDEIGEKHTEQAVAQTEAAAVVAETWQAYWDRESEQAQAWLDERTESIAAVAGAVQDLGAYFEELHRKRLDETMTEREAEIERIKTLRGEERAAAVEKLKQLTAQANEQRKQVNKAFQAQKAAQIAMALIDGARSALTLIPAFAYLGPAAPAAAAGVAAAATAVQIAQIAAQKPKFHTGLDPSETPAIITRGEGIANQRAMTSPVFREQLRAANAGEQAASGHGTVIMLNDRVLATLDRRTARVTGRVQSGRRVARVGTATHYDR